MRLQLTKAALTGLARMPPKQRLRMVERLEEIAAAPFSPQANVRKLVGRSEYRLRVGDWRALYIVVVQADLVTVTTVEIRGQVYT